MSQTSECGGFNYEVQVLKGNEIIFKAQFNVFSDIGALSLMAVIDLLKMIYPEAQVKTLICADRPVFALPLYENVIKSYVTNQITGTKFG